MATFPGGIDYTKASPSGKIPAVDMRMPATGGLEAIGRGLENLGQDFDRVDNAKAAIEFSTKKRQFEEMSNAALNAHKVSGDPVERQKQKEQWAKAADAFTSDNPRVARELTKYKNNVMPDIGQTFANHDLVFQAKQNKDAFQINLQHRMETGEIGEAAKDIHTYRVTTGQISEAEETEMVKDLPNESHITKGGKMIYTGDAINGLKELDMIDTKTLSEERAKHVKQLVSAAKQTVSQETGAVENEVTYTMHDNRSKSPTERMTIGEQQLAKLNTIRDLIPPARYSAMVSEIEKYQSGKAKEFDPITYVGLLKQVEQLHNGIGNPSDIRRNITESYDKLDDAHFDSLSKLSEEKIANYYSDTITRLRQEATPLLAPRMMMTERLMEAEAQATTPEAKKALHDQLTTIMAGDDAKVDSMRLSQYIDQLYQHLKDNPNEADLRLAGKKILGKFEKYTDPQIRKMQSDLENGIRQSGGQKTWKYRVKMPDGSIMGSDTGGKGTWQTIN